MSKDKKIVISIIIVIIGLIILCSEYFNSKKIAVYDYMNELYYTKENIETEEIIEENNKEEDSEENNTSYKFDIKEDESIYIGYLSIPDIDLKKGFTKKESKYNTISKNIQILSASDYPDKENGNVIFAAHSGNSSVSYFNKLYLLNIDALVYVIYNNVTYAYKITDIYTVKKSGEIEIKSNKNKSNITLITCTKNDNTTQTVYLGELISKE